MLNFGASKPRVKGGGPGPPGPPLDPHLFFYVRFHVLLFITKMIQFNYILLIHLDAMDNFGDEQ